ncbi:MAG: PASTA domain-containing protein [Clostridia bacterium]|nr:PASTA domain-containing protein [Clostridia bacterium]
MRESRKKSVAYPRLKGITSRRIIIAFTIICVACIGLCFRVGWIQVVKANEYSKMAIEQQTRDVPIQAKRGSILDRNGKELAVSAATYSVWARPAGIAEKKTGDEKRAAILNTADKLSEILDMDEEEIEAAITKEQSLVKITKYRDKDTADKIRAAKLPGIEISEEVKRYYPMGAFAAHVLGSVTDDNSGLAGIELKYNQYLSGVPGRWIKNTDVQGNSLSYGVEKYYKAEDGLSLMLTIDEVIQHYVEMGLEEVQRETQADRVMCIMMDPKTGDVLAMGMTPDYDPNNPRVPTSTDAAAYLETLPDDKKFEYWNNMWRNPMVSDVYEPGSTSKLLTTSMALEEGLTSLNEVFVCTYRYFIAGVELHCWRTGNPHGAETLVQAVGNSCNPVFATLSQRIGLTKFYDYLKLFGMTEKTGIDYPGEGNPILQNIDTAGPVGLATMSYGQGIAVTMLQQITAISSLGNDGKLMKPRLVKALLDSEGKVVEEFKPEIVRQVISKKTADEMCLIMESVVSEGGGSNAKVEGYRVGGKTGTANKAVNGKYSDETNSSFIGMAPMDDPKIAILLVVDNPKGVKYGSQTAAPGAQKILANVLRYMNIKPNYTQSEKNTIQNAQVAVPDVTGKQCYEEAVGILKSKGLSYVISPDPGEDKTDFAVVDQYPKAGGRINAGGTVYLYRE